jgi:hypothetical protein
MSDRITTLTDDELREFERLATVHGKYRHNFRIRQRDGSTKVEVLYEPRLIEVNMRTRRVLKLVARA